MAAALVGTAGWSIPRDHAGEFPADGAGLERYATRLPVVEINSSFHRPHRPSTWLRWGGLVPPEFRFAVKVPKTIAHERKLSDCGDLLDKFLEEVSGLGEKLAILLVQLPPKLAFEHPLAADFFGLMQERTRRRLVCEPRHASWFDPEPDAFLNAAEIARVAADPAPVAAAAEPGGWRGLSYWRLHGSPVIYRSPYGRERLAAYASRIAADPVAWCIFDNTASSAAMGDALTLQALLRS